MIVVRLGSLILGSWIGAALGYARAVWVDRRLVADLTRE